MPVANPFFKPYRPGKLYQFSKDVDLVPQTLQDVFTPQVDPDGTARLTHTSGSQIVFGANGDIQLVPARDLAIDPGRMVRVATTEEQALEFYRLQLLKRLQWALTLKQGGARGPSCC